MADSFTTSLLLRKPEVNANQNAWGPLANEDFGSDRLEQAIVGAQSYALTADKTLTRVNGETDEARMRVQNITSADAGYTVTIPAAPMWYFARNGSAFDQSITNGSNSVTIKAGNAVPVFSDGTNIYQFRMLDYGADLPRSTGTPANASDLVTKAYADNLAFSGSLPSQAPGVLKSDGMTASFALLTAGEITTALTYTPTSITGLTGVQSPAAIKTGLSLNLVENKSSATIRAEFTAATNTYTAKQTMKASAVGGAGFNLPVGTAPTVPVAGDIYPTSAGLNYYNGTVAVGLGPWRQIDTKSATGGSVTFTSIPQGFGDLLVVFDQISVSVNGNIGVALSDDGSNYTLGLSIAALASGFRTGSCLITGYRNGAGYMVIATASLAARSLDVADVTQGAWRVAPITHIQITPSAGAFDNGTFTLYAR